MPGKEVLNFMKGAQVALKLTLWDHSANLEMVEQGDVKQGFRCTGLKVREVQVLEVITLLYTISSRHLQVVLFSIQWSPCIGWQLPSLVLIV